MASGVGEVVVVHRLHRVKRWQMVDSLFLCQDECTTPVIRRGSARLQVIKRVCALRGDGTSTRSERVWRNTRRMAEICIEHGRQGARAHRLMEVEMKGPVDHPARRRVGELGGGRLERATLRPRTSAPGPECLEQPRTQAVPGACHWRRARGCVDEGQATGQEASSAARER